MLTISPTSDLDCTMLNGTNPYLILLGLLTIAFSFVYFSFHLTNGKFNQIKQVHTQLRQERLNSKTLKNYYILTLFDVFLRLWGPIAIVGAIRGLGIFLAWNSLVAIFSFISSGCF